MNQTSNTPFAAISHINALFAQTGAEIARLNQALARVLPTQETRVTVPLLRALSPIRRRGAQRQNQRATSFRTQVQTRATKSSSQSGYSRSRRLTIDEKNQALAWLQQGVAVGQIADQLKVTRPTIYNLRDKYLPSLNRRRGGYRHGKRNKTKEVVTKTPLVQIPQPEGNIAPPVEISVPSAQ